MREGLNMAFLKIITEVTGGEAIGILLLLVFIVIFIGTSFYVIKKYNSVVSTFKLSIGILIYFIISVLVSNASLNFLLFSEGEYFNHGLGVGLLRLLFSIFIGLLFGLLVTKSVYFKLVK